MNVNLMWFRNDLRLSDNSALHFSCRNNASTVLALFIATPKQWERHCLAPKKKMLIYKNIVALKKKITELGIIFYYYESTDYLESTNYIIEFCKIHKVTSIFFNLEYEFYERQRDKIIKKKLKKNNIIINCFHDSVLITPGSIKNSYGKMYKKFSYFKYKCIKQLQLNIPSCFPKPQNKNLHDHYSLDFTIPIFHTYLEKFDANIFPIGEDIVYEKLKFFIKYAFNKYNFDQEIFELNSTSMLSAHLSIGVISPRQCVTLLFKEYPDIIHKLEECKWINELLWREFYQHLLYFYPNIGQNQSLYHWENRIKWDNNLYYLNLWKQGNTGYPIIDAGMRQLKQLGWISNRLRMITASFLVKNLLIDWRKGEEYFMSQLIDGDFASNNGNWQWIASVGTDSMPYFRIFNPMLQSKKFDINAKFIRKYIPELSNVSTYNIHNPCDNNKTNKIHSKYPQPIINYYHSKKKTLLVFKHAKCSNKL
ncbi:deoxyribodipyrimidine photolyase [Buchnera aphidicola str. Bp (Baizongia pistaciae)]|uniref:Deoxyribodipyrimidine photo-lyase n=1 Tax=Buchnera aphidicola subsp. Baizongia pistaciae (strain Bp) TaxID=224915 RepID=PHR_BUCBP|nr:deoxyribodipyrimidine photo-lyase [Buchnera aphidicola]Q89AJ9.1 RecName: Full=Deoxyribodipyrimidine photo-lyase; AltName: Full=DNA photolyase; AltName: Full=Photoreactivating enzyme [Buchnera aphidicola str. Bp (Baizongia pistaciae)]AAO27003.1 deoxyribodipyrimidine photolyase [Buchnera aphidicola str. Bp (Baizongia pistaciae)]